MPEPAIVTHMSMPQRRTPGPVRFHHAFVLILVLLLLGLPVHSSAARPGGDAPPPAVVVTTVTLQEVNPATEYVGRMEAIQAVDLRARVEGELKKVAFQEGAAVNTGDLLYVIEQAPYKARLKQAQAGVTQAEAAFKIANQYLDRLKTVKSGGVSATDMDTAISNAQQARARLLEAQAGLEQAQLNLDYTTIYAPISGRIGRSTYTKGNIVNPASGALARIVQVDPIRVVYSMSEINLLETRMGQKSTDDRLLGELLLPRLKMANGEIYPQAGQLDFVDNQVDPATGTVAVRAVFDNPKALLMPGQYVTVLISLKEAKQLPVIPQSAVLEDRKGRYVFVVDETNTARRRDITTGAMIDMLWAVESGLSAGEKVVVQGLQKIKPDTPVNPQPEAGAAPQQQSPKAASHQ